MGSIGPDGKMDAYLMHGDIIVAELTFDVHGGIGSIGIIHDDNHMPVFTQGRKNEDLLRHIRRWWSKRAIPKSRRGIDRALIELGMSTPEQMMLTSQGLSLSDSYWVRPLGSELGWADVNYHRNGFSTEFGNLILFGDEGSGDLLESPDPALNGNLGKMWLSDGDLRLLMKGGTLPFCQQPFNEVISSEIMRRLGIEHVDYSLEARHQEPFCVCPGFCDERTEFIPAWEFVYAPGMDMTSIHPHVCRSLSDAGCNNVSDFLDRMIVVDYLVGNEDRHYGNFGLLRNADTLEVVGFAPMFDTGSSLGYNIQNEWIRKRYVPQSMTFSRSHEEQLRLVGSFDWMDLDRLTGMEDYVQEVFEGYGRYIDRDRVEAVSGFLLDRVEKLKVIAGNHRESRDACS